MVFNNVMVALSVYNDDPENPVISFYLNHRFLLFTGGDFLKGMTMLLLFYKQGQFFLEYT